jgi:hypothetical protein
VPATLFGLPAHALIVHAAVVLVPLAALLLALCALWPRLRRALGPLPAIGAAGALVLVPITTSSGEKLKARLGFDNPLIERHAALGHELLPWAAGLFVAAALLLVVDGWRPTAWATPAGAGTRSRLLALALSVVVLALAVVTVVEVVRIGHAGAEAVWKGSGS